MLRCVLSSVIIILAFQPFSTASLLPLASIDSFIASWRHDHHDRGQHLHSVVRSVVLRTPSDNST